MLKRSIRNEPIIKFMAKDPVNVHLIRNNDFLQRFITWEKAYSNESFLNGFFDDLKKDCNLNPEEKKKIVFSVILFFQAHSDGLMEVDWDRFFKMKKDIFVKYVNVNFELFEIHFPDRIKKFNAAIEKSKEKDSFSK